MKTFPSYDLLFIILSAIFLIGITYIVNVNILGMFSFIIALTGYYIGKVVRNHEIKKRKE